MQTFLHALGAGLFTFLVCIIFCAKTSDWETSEKKGQGDDLEKWIVILSIGFALAVFCISWGRL